jgi:MFS family permease
MPPIVSVIAVLITSGMGSILITVEKSYNFDPRTTDLMTYPTMFMGIGNLLSIPLALVIGRRPVFLMSALIMVIGSIWCACSTSLESHIAGRDFLSLGAGQSEALCPLIIQEIHFLHERSSRLSWFSAMQSIGTAAFVIATSYLVAELGWKWWYGIFGVISGLVLITSFLFIPETRYDRPTDAFEGEVHIHQPGHQDTILRVTDSNHVEFDLVRYKPRTVKDDLAIFHGPADWRAGFDCVMQALQCALFPNVLWIALMNSAFLGVYVVMVTEFAGILVAPPYQFPYASLGLVQGGQIVVSIILVPIFGYGGDRLTRFIASHRGGIAEPEYRLLPMIIPLVVTVVSCLLFGMAGSHPTEWSPWAVIVGFNGSYFGFICVILLGYTYCLDAYPERAAPILVLICSVRGFISFGISFGITAFVNSKGYEGALNICAIAVGALSVFGLPVYILGKKIRKMTMKYAVDDRTLEL